MGQEFSPIHEVPKSVEVLRWLGVLPCGLLCAILATFPIHWAVMLIQLFGKAGDEAVISIDGKTPLAAISPEILERFGYALFTPLALIIVGAKVAPKYKLPTGMALAAFWAVIFGISTCTTLVSHRSDWSWLRLAVTCVLGIAGVALGLLQVYNSQRETSDAPPQLSDDQLRMLDEIEAAAKERLRAKGLIQPHDEPDSGTGKKTHSR